MVPGETGKHTDRRPARFRLISIIGLIAAALIVLRYATIMLPSTQTTVAPRVEEIERGPILDRNGRILAIQTRLDTVTAWRPAISEPEETARILEDILNLETGSVREQLVASTGFTVIARTITPSQSERIRAQQQQGRLEGIRLEADSGRSYPERESAAALIGFTGVDNVGLTGIEYMFSGDLMPAPAENAGLAIGNQVFLTIDLAIQSAADQLGQRLLAMHQADSVMILVAAARTGELLAVSSVPSFDPNNFARYTADERRNLPISRVYEPGSVFKVFSVAAFLELEGIDLTDQFNTTGGYASDDGSFLITDLADYGFVDAEEIIKYSSNVGAAYASERVEPGSLYATLRRFGFGEPTEIDLNGEERGLLATPERWSARTRPTLAIGQEIGVTAVQMIAAATVLANDGVLLRPQIVDRIISPTGEIVRQFEREAVREVLSPATARTMLELMDRATDPDATGRRIQVEGVSVAAKTGTAEVFDPELGTYSDEHFIASTLALVPADEPELIVYVVIDHPRGESYLGGRIAAPAVDEMIEFLVPYWDIPRDTDTVVEHPGRIVARQPQLPPLTATVPDYRDLPIRTLLPLLGREDVDVRISGSGWVIRQNPPPGTPFEPGMRIDLELE